MLLMIGNIFNLTENMVISFKDTGCGIPEEVKDKIFTPFGDARWKIEGEAVKSREIYFAIYQSLAKDEEKRKIR